MEKNLWHWFIVVMALFLNYAKSAETLPNSTLKCVQVVWRHGDRNPYEIWPTDQQNGAESWPEGLGELTKEGIRQMFDLGQLFHDQYSFLLNFTWNPDYVKFYSGESNRTIASAQALTVGMFPPVERQIWNPDLLWLPIPIHSRDFLEWIEADSAVLWACPNLRYIATEEGMIRLRTENSELINQLEELSGKRIQNVLFDLGPVLDPLICERYHNNIHQWPSGVTEEMYLETISVNNASRELVYTAKDGLSLTGGWLLSQLIENLQDFVTGDSEKVFIGYSGHDENLKALAATFGVIGWFWGYASYIAIELHERDDEEIIEIWYRNDTYGPRQRIYLSDCPDPCSFLDFISRSQPYFPVTEWDEACGKNTTVYQGQLFWAIGILAALSILFLLISLISCVLFCRLRRKLKHREEIRPLLISK